MNQKTLNRVFIFGIITIGVAVVYLLFQNQTTLPPGVVTDVYYTNSPTVIIGHTMFLNTNI